MKKYLVGFVLLFGCAVVWPSALYAQPGTSAVLADSTRKIDAGKQIGPAATRFYRLFVDTTQPKIQKTPAWGNFPKMEPSRLRSINVNGFYRFFGTYRDMPGSYRYLPQANLPQREVFIGDDTQLPNLMFFITGKSRSGLSWGLDLFAFQFLDRPGLPAYSPASPDTARPNIDNPLGSPRLGQSMLLNLGMNLYSTVQTSLGPLTVKLGGIHWEDMTDLTMGGYTAYERYMLFDRNPWDPIGQNVHERYNRYVDAGRVDQEERWGKRAFAGAVVSMTQLPYNQSLKLMFGKNEQNGGFDRRPNAAWGGQYSWMPRTGWKLSLQSMNQRSYQDSLLLQPFGSQIHTVKVGRTHPVIGWELETGYSGYQSNSLGQLGGLIAQAKFKWEPLKHLKLFGQSYYIDPGAVNNIGAFVNTSVSEAATTNIPVGQAGSGALLFPSSSSLLGFGQLANNRMGADLNVAYSPANISLSGGYSLSRELNTGSSSLSYTQPVNALTRSRFWRWGFPQQVGPYGRTSVLYRSTFDKVAFTERQQEHLYFSQLELQALYRIRVADRVLVFNQLLRAQSVQTSAALLNTSPEAILRQYSSQNELYLQWNSRFSLVFLASADISLGGVLTGVNTLGRPLEQFGKALGLGCDIWAADNVCVYLRHKSFAFEDRSFVFDTYSGTETTLELKLLF